MATHFTGPVHSSGGFIDGSGDNIVTGADLVAVTATAAEIDTLAGVTAGTALADKALVLNASKGISTITSATITTLTSTAVNATTVTPVTLAVTGHTSLSVAAKTAGTTQTQAGAVAITSTITLGTTGNADDGYLLPAMTAGKVIIVVNLSANAAKIYGNGTETLNGTAGNAGSTALAASKTTLIIGTGAGTAVTATLE